MKKRSLKIVGIVITCVLTIGIISICIFTGIQVFNGSMEMSKNEKTGIEKAERYFEKRNFDLEEITSKYIIETLEIESSLGEHMIPIDHITLNGGKNCDTVIMAHGLGGNRWANYHIASIFLENGYNVISYDQRSSGNNMAKYTTYGYYESHDLADCVLYAKEFIKDDKEIGIWGSSLGGATVGIYLGTEAANKYVDFAILDSPLSNMRELLSMEMEKMDMAIPTSFMLSMGNMMTKMKLGFSYEDTNVCEYIDKTTVAVLIINSKTDEITPYFMGIDIYNAISHDNKSILTVEDGVHAEIFYDYPEEYKNTILDFIKETQQLK